MINRFFLELQCKRAEEPCFFKIQTRKVGQLKLFACPFLFKTVKRLIPAKPIYIFFEDEMADWAYKNIISEKFYIINGYIHNVTRKVPLYDLNNDRQYMRMWGLVYFGLKIFNSRKKSFDTPSIEENKTKIYKTNLNFDEYELLHQKTSLINTEYQKVRNLREYLKNIGIEDLSEKD